MVVVVASGDVLWFGVGFIWDLGREAERGGSLVEVGRSIVWYCIMGYGMGPEILGGYSRKESAGWLVIYWAM